MLELYMQPASSYATEIDNVVWIVLVLVGFWFTVTSGMFFWLLWRYREREGHKAIYVTGHEPELHRWIAWPHYAIILCDMVIIVAAVRVWYHVKQELPEPEQTVRVIAQQWAWSFVHPGPDGQLDTADDIKTVDNLHVEVGKIVHFKLESRDVLHSFSVPVFRLKQDAIPGRVITGWFEATIPGSYDIQCTEICGIGHGIMPARIHVDTPEQHQAWLAQATM